MQFGQNVCVNVSSIEDTYQLLPKWVKRKLFKGDGIETGRFYGQSLWSVVRECEFW